MNSESQNPISTPAVKDIKVRNDTPYAIQLINKRPYSKMISFFFSGRQTKSNIIHFRSWHQLCFHRKYIQLKTKVFFSFSWDYSIFCSFVALAGIGACGKWPLHSADTRRVDNTGGEAANRSVK